MRDALRKLSDAATALWIEAKAEVERRRQVHGEWSVFCLDTDALERLAGRLGEEIGETEMLLKDMRSRYTDVDAAADALRLQIKRTRSFMEWVHDPASPLWGEEQ